MVFDYMDEKWDSLLEQYGDVSFTLPNIVSSVTSNLNSDFDVEKLNRFLANHPYTGIAEPAFNNALETVGTNNKWVKRNKDSIKKWLNDNVKPGKYESYLSSFIQIKVFYHILYMVSRSSHNNSCTNYCCRSNDSR